MKLTRLLSGSLLFLLLLSAACSDSEDEGACQEGEFQCVGQELQKCDADGVYQAEEMCGGGSTCMASMGHCHMGEGGHSAGGHSAGGHSAGGHSAGGHMGGHMGGSGGHMGGAGGS